MLNLKMCVVKLKKKNFKNSGVTHVHVFQAFAYSAELWDPVPCSNKCSEDKRGSKDITGGCGHRGRGPPGHSGATGANKLEFIFPRAPLVVGMLNNRNSCIGTISLR